MHDIELCGADGSTDTRTRAVPLAWRPLLIILAVTGCVHLAVATRFGWHRDEFYYLIAGRHLAWGYPDQPPLSPLLARLAGDLPGGLLPLRLFAIAAELGCVLLTGKLAAEFGGRARAQAIAAAATAASPVFVAASALFGTTVMDELGWAAVFVTVARALRCGTVRSWLTAGVVAGLGLENKDTVGVLLLGIGVGLAWYRRSVLRTPGPWLAAAVAALLLVPNLVWNARHDWAQFHMAGVLSAREGGPLGALANLPLLVLLAGPLIMVWLAGLRWLASPAGREHRWVLVAAATVVVVFTASGGKTYYIAPALIGLFAAGGVRSEIRAEDRSGLPAAPRRTRWWSAITVTAVLAVLFGLPVLPVSADEGLRQINPVLVETYGWPDFVRQVTAVADTLPPGAIIFTSNYGEAGALTVLGPGQGLRVPVSSAHNGYILWGPPAGTPGTVLCVGEWNADYLHRFWGSVQEIAPITMPGGIVDEETANHAGIYLCRQPRGSWAQMWPGLSHLD